MPGETPLPHPLGARLPPLPPRAALACLPRLLCRLPRLACLPQNGKTRLYAPHSPANGSKIAFRASNAKLSAKTENALHAKYAPLQRMSIIAAACCPPLPSPTAEKRPPKRGKKEAPAVWQEPPHITLSYLRRLCGTALYDGTPLKCASSKASASAITITCRASRPGGRAYTPPR
jgi:hypothetical protein